MREPKLPDYNWRETPPMPEDEREIIGRDLQAINNIIRDFFDAMALREKKVGEKRILRGPDIYGIVDEQCRTITYARIFNSSKDLENIVTINHPEDDARPDKEYKWGSTTPRDDLEGFRLEDVWQLWEVVGILREHTWFYEGFELTNGQRKHVLK